MADKHDKQFDPTPQRIKKAREDGNVFRSAEINSVVTLSLAVMSAAIFGQASLAVIVEHFAELFSFAAFVDLNVQSAPVIIVRSMLGVGVVVLPFMLLMTVAGVALSAGQSGITISTKPLEPKPERISPLKGFKRIFSSRGLFSAAKSFLKIAIVGPIAYAFIKARIPEILELHTIAASAIPGVLVKWITILGGQMQIGAHGGHCGQTIPRTINEIAS